MKTQPRPNINSPRWRDKHQLIFTIIICTIVVGLVAGLSFLFLVYKDSWMQHMSLAPPAPTPSTPHTQTTPAHTQTDTLINFILEQEGGYNPADPSYEGVYQPTWDWYREVAKDPSYPVNVRRLVDRPELIVEFYHWYLYELNSGVNDVPDWFRLMLADFWTTSMSESIKPLQIWARVERDGIWGSHTKAAVIAKFQQVKDKIAMARWYTKYRKDHYRARGHHESSGLMTRSDIVLAETIKRIQGDVTPVMHRTIDEVDMRVHAPSKPLTNEERLDRLETLILQLTNK